MSRFKEGFIVGLSLWSLLLKEMNLSLKIRGKIFFLGIIILIRFEKEMKGFLKMGFNKRLVQISRSLFLWIIFFLRI